MVRIVKSDPVQDLHCIDCYVDTFYENYMIHDELWLAANPAGAGMLCVGCCERRLGRRLRRDDFQPCALAAAFDEGMPVSDRLRDRMRW